MTAFRVGTADPGYALEIAAAGTKPLADLLNTLKAVHAVGGGVLLIILLAEVVEVTFEDGMELVATTRNVPILCRGRDGGNRAHISLYEQNALPASHREHIHRAPHNMAHSPDAFSSPRSCEGAGDARR